jgi:hypothetical protein
MTGQGVGRMKGRAYAFRLELDGRLFLVGSATSLVSRLLSLSYSDMDSPLGKGADDHLGRRLIMVQPTIHHLFLLRLRFRLTDEKMRRVPASRHVEEVVKV